LGRRWVFVAAIVAAGCGWFMVESGPSLSSGQAVLSFRAVLATDSSPVACPPQAPAGADCRARTGRGAVSGLGSVTATYTWFYAPGDCASGLVKPFATTARYVVAGKGAIDFAIADGPRCVEQEPVRNEPQEFTITGGTGKYQGSSGHGTLTRSLAGGQGVEYWAGNLDVLGLGFDTTAPTITGASAKTVRAGRAKRVRVNYKVTAMDAVDGAVTASCTPRSGTFFKLGRTVVTCSATDASGNGRTARFAITVRR
jgi:hypothetical protein